MTRKERRLKLSEMLHDVLGSKQVYYEPPESIKMSYPAIVYARAGEQSVPADDIKYLTHGRYTITFIHKDADNAVADKIAELKYCEYDRSYASDDLHHDVFTIYV